MTEVSLQHSNAGWSVRGAGTPYGWLEPNGTCAVCPVVLADNVRAVWRRGWLLSNPRSSIALDFVAGFLSGLSATPGADRSRRTAV